MSLSLLRTTVGAFMDAVQIGAWQAGIALRYRKASSIRRLSIPTKNFMRFIRKPVSSPGNSDDDKDGRRSAKLSAWNVDDGWGHPTFFQLGRTCRGIISINLSEVLTESDCTDSSYSQSQMLNSFDAFRIGLCFLWRMIVDVSLLFSGDCGKWRVVVIKPEKKNSHDPSI